MQCVCRLTNQANRPRADGAPAPPASGPVERVVSRHSVPPPTRRTYAKLAASAMTNGTRNTTNPVKDRPDAYSG
jgi:hypothetical protein